MIGRTLGHYRILEQVGAGGMGVVYRARDERLRRDVALKVLANDAAGQQPHRELILAEARAASALNHPVITTIYEVGEEGEQLFIVMELVAGKTLRVLVAEGPLDPRTLLPVAAQVADGLSAAHERSIVHGDVKPENIIVQPDGRVKLLDFGIARHHASETATVTRTALGAGATGGQIAGTLAYLAPEQWRGEKSDQRADLFSLGVVLYEAATGHRPFAAPSAAALMAQVLHETPALLSACAPGASAELERVIHRLLEKQPSARYQSARELQADLAGLSRETERRPAIPALPAKRAVAVLPWKLLTPSVEDDYLGVALADAVITELSAGGELLVRPTSTVLRYARQGIDPLAAARELNVQVVVDGSIQKFGQRLRVTVQVWNAADGSALLSAKHEADMADLFGLQDRIAAAVAEALGGKPAAELTTAAPPTKNTKAYEFFLRASERLARLNRWDMRSAGKRRRPGPALCRRLGAPGRGHDPDGRDLRAWAAMVSARRASHPQGPGCGSRQCRSGLRPRSGLVDARKEIPESRRSPRPRPGLAAQPGLPPRPHANRTYSSAPRAARTSS